jgi:mannan endo-1,4-beta-mannosidase
MTRKGNRGLCPRMIIELMMMLTLIIPVAACSSSQYSPVVTPPKGFVTRSATQLLLDGQPFRFAGANMHWLGLDDSTNYSSQFRINDGLDAAKEMGANVIRSHDLGISTGCRNCIEPSLGVFNQTALAHDDYVIKAAKDRGIRLIIPLTDNWHYPAGGKHDFTDWRGIADENRFYSNPLVISDFETYIKTLIDHVNSYTGVAYKDDPTIMAWETGNELQPPTTWTQIISTYIKSIDHNHLVIDGKAGIDPDAASLTNVDMVSDHYYPKSVADLKNDAALAKKVGKVFYAGEYDWNDANGGDPLSSFLAAIESDTTIGGDSYWELWSHNDRYGYMSNGIRYTLHYPGDTSAMRESVQQLRAHAYRMRQMPVPAVGVPGVPLLHMVIKKGTKNALIWSGTALAASYTIERSTVGAKGPWKVMCDTCVSDLSPPWVDETTPAVSVVWYRITAYNVSGAAGKPSLPYLASGS